MGGEHREYEVADYPKERRRMIRRGDQIDIYKYDDAKKRFPLLDD